MGERESLPVDTWQTRGEVKRGASYSYSPTPVKAPTTVSRKKAVSAPRTDEEDRAASLSPRERPAPPPHPDTQCHKDPLLVAFPLLPPTCLPGTGRRGRPEERRGSTWEVGGKALLLLRLLLPCLPLPQAVFTTRMAGDWSPFFFSFLPLPPFVFESSPSLAEAFVCFRELRTILHFSK